jgi:hypothetical protein
MRTKATFLTGFATGYVLGARAGRARYEQIRQAARALASNPTVQSKASTLQHQATDALSTAKDKATSTIGSKVQEKRPSRLRGDTPANTVTGIPGETAPAGSNGHLS